MRRLTLILCMFVVVCLAYSQRTASVCGEVDYVVPETQTLADAKRTALTQARLNAIAEEFGTVVSQTNTSTMHKENGKEHNSFNSFSENEVRGIWLDDTKEPVVNVGYNNGMTVIHVEVCGKAREQKRASIEMQVKTLNNGTETDKFRSNDRFSVSFKSASSGYVAIFIRDEINDIVNVMMPYDGGDGNAREVKSNREYLFLTTKDPEYPYKEETILTTQKSVETNTLVVVFSQKQFHVALTNKGEFVPEVENSKFQRWLHGLRVFDNTVQVIEKVLTIKK